MPSATILTAVLCEVSLLGRGKEQTPNPYRPVQLLLEELLWLLGGVRD